MGSFVAVDALVLKHLTTSIHKTDYMPVISKQFHKMIAFKPKTPSKLIWKMFLSSSMLIHCGLVAQNA